MLSTTIPNQTWQSADWYHFDIRLSGWKWSMDFELGLVTVPVSDVDRAQFFYAERVGFTVDHDHIVNESLRFDQMTLPGSACSFSARICA